MRKVVSIVQAMILMRLRPIAISQAIVHGKGADREIEAHYVEKGRAGRRIQISV